MILQQIIEKMYDMPVEEINRNDALQAIDELKIALNRGEVRSADYYSGWWCVNQWVKKGIILAFRIGELSEMSEDDVFQFFDKDTMGVRQFSVNHGVRIVPGGSIVRDGAFIGEGVVMMPPSYVNIGAYVDEGTMIDSHALVGSCAQIGKRVHLSAAAQIGGVLEPVGSMPVIIEDDVFIGGNCGVYEGTIVKKNAVLAAGVILTRATPVYDIAKKTIHRSSATNPLTIPEGAVIVPGSRQMDNQFAREYQLSLYTPIIIKYRDEKTNVSLILEESLR
ncbi:MAG: 2,3,4,5-tetrahydropyridine-2,6-dicarboxylate N-succinyltransferase [Ignavibacteriales bacterium]|nr:2,3,4,5-tetrahydropyridine-2,6-dicarboxylate N-succinyltransferase [Ignavibacteriales bacterium]